MVFAKSSTSLQLIPISQGAVKVKGHCYRNNQPVIEVVSSFLYHGRFVDYENTFDTTEDSEPHYLVHLESDADVGVLQ